MKKIILILTTAIISTSSFAQFADPCDFGPCDDRNFYNHDDLSKKWERDELESDRVMRELYKETYKGIPQSFYQ